MAVVGILPLDEGGPESALDDKVAYGREDGQHGYEGIVVGAQDVGYDDDYCHL